MGSSLWAPGRREDTAPREEQETAFLYHQWGRDGLLQWGALAGIAHTAARAADTAPVAAMLVPGPTTLAVDNQGTVDCIQGITKGHMALERAARGGGMGPG